MIYYLVRNLTVGPRHGLYCDGPNEAATLAKEMSRKYKTPYSVFKVTEQMHGTYRPGDSYG